MKKNLKRKMYGVIAAALICSTGVAAVGLNIFSKANKETGAGQKDYASIERDTFISVDGSGVLKIDRNEKE